MSRNFPKFKYGDNVETQYKLKAKVVSVIKQSGEFLVTVEDSKGSRTEHKEDTLIFDSKYLKEEKKIEIGKDCPKCSEPFKITQFGNKKWKDCIPCGKTAEELCAIVETEDPQQDFATYSEDEAWKMWVPC